MKAFISRSRSSSNATSQLRRAFTTTSNKARVQFTSAAKSNKKLSIISAAALTTGSLIYLSSLNTPILNEAKIKKMQRIVILEDDEDDEEEEEDDDEDEHERFERQRQLNIQNKPHLSQVFSLSDFEAIAKAVLPKGAWGYYSTGSDDEVSLRENHYAYGRVFFRPRCLVDVDSVSIEHEMMGANFAAPFYITAFAGSPMAHPDAERNLQQAAGKENISHMIPFQLSYSADEYHNSLLPGQQNFQQLHFYTQEQFDKAGEFFKNLETSRPNVKAVFINVDLATIGNREKDSKIRAALDPASNDELAVFTTSDAKYFTMTWKHFEELKKLTNLPIVLKGVLNRYDVLKAAELGFAGAVISNHGGRQLDFAMPPLEILIESKKLLKEKNLDANFDIFVDGGIRRGSDIIKALCLGAAGVGLGRPFLYAMSGYGEPGVQKAIQILKSEMVRDMKLLGVTSISELNEDMVDATSLKYKGIQSSDMLYNYNYTEMPPPKFKS
ncbi:hypothetical protein CANARDRAFT_29333 [[Candida] arabinofermentans NRRL YB-2248]|uniref:FMN hydroxy acid dehydrogenase domain-containing protein n=1 Tax=[Candida] arabinofermentans NRRL YB-2248 TaxID=983967 RepID=A0A1E4SXF6_9ASCO|nr:hypothetical protein CANARDRAFT_29333 [[Candida] arabinofermentans NRRL YB-2248]